MAGLKASSAKAVVLIDADLEHPPNLIKQMYEIWFNKKAKMIYAKCTDRTNQSFLKSKFSQIFYYISNLISDIKLESGVKDYRLMDRVVINELIKMNEYHRFSKMMFEWVGFETVCLEYSIQNSAIRNSNWNFLGLFKYAIDGIISFSTKPLRLAFWVGLIISLISGIYGLYIVFDTLIAGNDVKGYPSLVTIILFLGGIQLIVLGVIGEYLARIYEEVKKRPHYIIEETLDKDEK